MPGRKTKKFFKEGPSEEMAIALVNDIFALCQKLEINYKQLTVETGLTPGQVHYLRYVWANSQAAKPERMFPSLANELVRFWNKHLTNSQPAAAPKVAVAVRVAVKAEDNIFLQKLVEKVGPADAAKMLLKRGKAEAAEKLLKDLSPEQLAELV